MIHDPWACFKEPEEIEKLGLDLISIEEFCMKNNFYIGEYSDRTFKRVGASPEYEFLYWTTLSLRVIPDEDFSSKKGLPCVYVQEAPYSFTFLYKEQDLEDCLNLTFPPLLGRIEEIDMSPYWQQAQASLSRPYKFGSNLLALHNYIYNVDVKLPLSTTIMSINDYARSFIAPWEQKFYNIGKNFSSNIQPFLKKGCIQPKKTGTPYLYALKDIISLHKEFIKKREAGYCGMYYRDYESLPINDWINSYSKNYRLADFEAQYGSEKGCNFFRNLVCRENSRVLLKFPTTLNPEDFDSTDYNANIVSISIPFDLITFNYECNSGNIIWNTEDYISLDSSFSRLSGIYEEFNKLIKLYEEKGEIRRISDVDIHNEPWAFSIIERDRNRLAAKLLWKAIVSLRSSDILNDSDIFYSVGDMDNFLPFVSKARMFLVKKAFVSEIREELDGPTFWGTFDFCPEAVLDPEKILTFLNKNKDKKYTLTELSRELRYSKETIKSYAWELLDDNLIKIVDTIKLGNNHLSLIYQGIEGPDVEIPVIKENSSKFKELLLQPISNYINDKNRRIKIEALSNRNLPYYIVTNELGGCRKMYREEDVYKFMKSDPLFIRSEILNFLNANKLNKYTTKDLLKNIDVKAYILQSILKDLRATGDIKIVDFLDAKGNITPYFQHVSGPLKSVSVLDELSEEFTKLHLVSYTEFCKVNKISCTDQNFGKLLCEIKGNKIPFYYVKGKGGYCKKYKDEELRKIIQCKDDLPEETKVPSKKEGYKEKELEMLGSVQNVEEPKVFTANSLAVKLQKPYKSVRKALEAYVSSGDVKITEVEVNNRIHKGYVLNSPEDMLMITERLEHPKRFQKVSFKVKEALEAPLITEEPNVDANEKLGLFNWVKNFNFFGFQISISKKRKKTISNSGQDLIEF